MSEILNNLVIQPITATIVVGTTPISITPTATQLNIYGGVAQPTTPTSLNADISNVHISSGTNGFVLQTDGTGNLTWTAQIGGGGGNGAPGGANTQIQYNNSGVFAGAAGFTYNSVTGNVIMPGNLTVAGILSASVATSLHANVADSANSVNAANIAGIVDNANYAAYSGNITISAQPNITSVGTLTSLIINGTATLQQAVEKVNIITAGANSTSNVHINLLDQAITYYNANATSNFSIYVAGNSTTTLNSILAIGKSITFSLLSVNGTPGYYANLFYIDGALLTPKYVGGAPTNGTNGAIDVYTYNLIKTDTNTWTVLGSKLGYI